MLEFLRVVNDSKTV